ncbi:hypothetical protein V8E36_004353 [Tilletia maclaganii]
MNPPLSSPQAPPDPAASRPLLGGTVAISADVFGPNIPVPATPASKRVREATATETADTPGSTTSSVAAGASPHKKTRPKASKKGASGPDLDSMGLDELLQHVKHLTAEVERLNKANSQLKAVNKKLVDALPKQRVEPAPRSAALRRDDNDGSRRCNLVPELASSSASSAPCSCFPG